MKNALLTLTVLIARMERLVVLGRVVGSIFLFDHWKLLVLLVANGTQGTS